MDNFQKLSISGWRQYESVDVEFGNNLTVLTGPNGCGKTTILNILGRHFGWNVNLVATPFMGKKKRKRFWADVWRDRESDFESSPNANKVGNITYDSGSICDLLVPDQENNQYALTYQGQKQVLGLNIPSHRPIVTYNQIQDIPTNPQGSAQQFQSYQQLLLQTYGSGRVQNPGLILKKSLVSLAVFGYGNDAVQENAEFRELFEEFERIIEILLPPTLGFKRLEIRIPDIVLVTDSGDFSLDAMSGGVGALFSIAWQIHMFGKDKSIYTVLIDEPENHLHPSMQRQILPSLVKAFPDCRFIVSTHSPFVVSSAPDARVYGLIYNNKNKIISHEYEDADLSGSANKILREILDVDSTIPIWVEQKMRSIVDELSQHQNSPEAAKMIYEKLRSEGLSESLLNYLDRK